MSTFYGQLQGSRGTATRCGTENSGIEASLQSWHGSMQVMLSHDENGELYVEVSTANGSTRFGSMVFRGTFERFKAMCQREMAADL